MEANFFSRNNEIAGINTKDLIVFTLRTFSLTRSSQSNFEQPSVWFILQKYKMRVMVLIICTKRMYYCSGHLWTVSKWEHVTKFLPPFRNIYFFYSNWYDNFGLIILVIRAAYRYFKILPSEKKIRKNETKGSQNSKGCDHYFLL